MFLYGKRGGIVELQLRLPRIGEVKRESIGFSVFFFLYDHVLLDVQL